MESADINAAFGALFGALRTNIRRGLSTEGQLYAMEMDGCIPGGLLATTWLPLSTRGVEDAAALADGTRRHALFDRLLAEPRPEALFAYVCERPPAGRASAVLYLEVVSADGAYAAEYPIGAGSGWHRRDIVKVLHRRMPSTSELSRRT